jgi:hypothetical protein
MAARKWTPEQRAQQAVKIRHWQPWTKSTGAQTPEGKAKVSQNARRFTFRKAKKFAQWLIKQANNHRQGKRSISILICEKRMQLFGFPMDLIKRQLKV